MYRLLMPGPENVQFVNRIGIEPSHFPSQLSLVAWKSLQ
jgi:hypothetical protein